jgi:prevent-host-death family protein
MATRIGAYEAKTKLPELLRRVEAGERFTITNRGQPVAELRPVSLGADVRVRESIALMRDLPKVQGISSRVVRSLIDEGRR